MLGYAIETRPARRKASPTTLALIAAGHAALILAVMSSRMDLPARFVDKPPKVYSIPLPKDPPRIPPEPLKPATTPRAATQVPLDRPIVIVPIRLPERPINLDLPLTISGDSGHFGIPTDPPRPLARVGPKIATPDSVLRPPYPEAKRRLEEEAVLRLRLSIDERGRVRSVDPIGAADPMFLASARNHLIRHWHYTPASEGGRPVVSSIIINLRFELDNI